MLVPALPPCISKDFLDSLPLRFHVSLVCCYVPRYSAYVSGGSIFGLLSKALLYAHETSCYLVAPSYEARLCYRDFRHLYITEQFDGWLVLFTVVTSFRLWQIPLMRMSNRINSPCSHISLLMVLSCIHTLVVVSPVRVKCSFFLKAINVLGLPGLPYYCF